MPIYNDQERGTWYFDIRYRDSTGKVRSIKRRGFETMQKAKNAERKMLRELTVDDLPKSTIGLRDIGLEMVDNSRHDIKEATFKANMHKVRTFIPNTAISSITARKALMWRNSLADITTPVKTKKDGSQIGGKPYSTKYKNEIITMYKSIFKYAIKMDYAIKNVAEDLVSFKKSYEDTVPFSIVSYDSFMDTWKLLPEKTLINIYFKYFLLLSFTTGARRAELKGLTFKDYDGKGITINKSVTGKALDRTKIEKTKTAASIRYVELDDYTISALNDYVKYIKTVYSVKTNAFLFGVQDPLPNNTIQYSFKRIGFDCRLHDLRHSHATLLIQNGVPINVVSRRLGHSTVEMTLKVYTHIFEEAQDQAISVMNSLSK